MLADILAYGAVRPPEMTIVSVYYPAGESKDAHEMANDRELPHLLEIPREVRERMYDFINYDIQKARLVLWNHNTRTEYEGLRLVCRKLYEETYHRIFHYTITSQQPAKLFTVPLNKQTFKGLRMLTFEIDHNAEHSIYAGFCEALQCLQLTIQELHILFVGKDRNGVQTGLRGCGNLNGWNDHCQYEQDLLQLKGQHIDKTRFALYHQLSLMRQLRVLRVRNANIPLIQGMTLVNKPLLRALSVVCDPRTVFHTYRTVPRHLLKGMLTTTTYPPAVKVLELTANSVVPGSTMVSKLTPTLEHFTWIIPHFEYQEKAGADISYDFYEEMGHIVHFLAWQASYLKVLRLCISMRETSGLSNIRTERDMDVMAANFRRYLPRFRNLEHLEIHYSGGAGFFRDHLIEYLPSSLRRLYITDNTIAPIQLQKQVWDRYFRPLYLQTGSYDEPYGSPNIDKSCENDVQIEIQDLQECIPPSHITIVVDECGWPHYFTEDNMQPKHCFNHKALICQRRLGKEDDNDFLEEPDQIIGEQRLRGDYIAHGAVSTGRLGCITYEFTRDEVDETSSSSVDNEEFESNTHIMVRLCGKLLDRERHMHLKYEPSLESNEGIRPPTMIDSEVDVPPYDRNPAAETAQYSCHVSIHSAIYNVNETAPRQNLVDENSGILSTCLGEHWYFGLENEAWKVFENEPPAHAELQRPRSILEIVDSPCDKKCRWMSPDYRVDPVGLFPVPRMPQDWQSKMYK